MEELLLKIEVVRKKEEVEADDSEDEEDCKESVKKHAKQAQTRFLLRVSQNPWVLHCFLHRHSKCRLQNYQSSNKVFAFLTYRVPKLWMKLIFALDDLSKYAVLILFMFFIKRRSWAREEHV